MECHPKRSLYKDSTGGHRGIMLIVTCAALTCLSCRRSALFPTNRIGKSSLSLTLEISVCSRRISSKLKSPAISSASSGYAIRSISTSSISLSLYTRQWVEQRTRGRSVNPSWNVSRGSPSPRSNAFTLALKVRTEAQH